MDELVGVVNLYPWFAAARKELCVRMSNMAGDSWGVGQYADQAMYIPERSYIVDIMRSGADRDYSDSDIESLLAQYVQGGKSSSDSQVSKTSSKRMPGGDFFSQDEYEKVRREEDNFMVRPVQKKKSPLSEDGGDSLNLEFYTETLAEIYAEQGYYQQAKRIYTKLILAYPEKSAYFASLIENLDKLINNQVL